MLAAEGKVDFVVSLAGSIVSGQKILLEQNQWMLQQAGYAPEVVERYWKVLEGLFNDVKAGTTPVVDSEGLPVELAQNLQAVKAQCSTPYMRYFLALDASTCLNKVKCPVLALNGTKDCQVGCEENLNILRKGLLGRRKYTPLRASTICSSIVRRVPPLNIRILKKPLRQRPSTSSFPG